MIKKYRVLKNKSGVPEGIKVIEVVYETKIKGHKVLVEIESLSSGNTFPYFLEEKYLQEI